MGRGGEQRKAGWCMLISLKYPCSSCTISVATPVTIALSCQHASVSVSARLRRCKFAAHLTSEYVYSDHTLPQLMPAMCKISCIHMQRRQHLNTFAHTRQCLPSLLHPYVQNSSLLPYSLLSSLLCSSLRWEILCFHDNNSGEGNGLGTLLSVLGVVVTAGWGKVVGL